MNIIKLVDYNGNTVTEFKNHSIVHFLYNLAILSMGRNLPKSSVKNTFVKEDLGRNLPKSSVKNTFVKEDLPPTYEEACKNK